MTRKKGQRIPPKGTIGSRASGRRPSARRVQEVDSSRPRLVSSRSRTDLGPTREERRREIRAVFGVLWLSVFIFLVLSGTLLTYQSWAFLAGDKEDAVVPIVVGLPYEDAALSVEQSGLVLRVRNQAYSDDVDTDLVIEQVPAGGSHVKIDREVLVDVSLGSRTLTTPNVIGLDRAEAEAQLEALGVVPRFQPPRYSDVAPNGTVINQRPPSGAPIALGEGVELVTSAGPLNRAVEMPNLTGLAYEQALQIINNERLVLRRVSRTYILGAREITVSSQYPLAGSQVMQGEDVLLTLSVPTEYETLGRRTFRVSVDIPESAGTVRVRITVQDRYETNEVYAQDHTGPATVEQLITSYGRSTVRILFGNRLIREETF